MSSRMGVLPILLAVFIFAVPSLFADDVKENAGKGEPSLQGAWKLQSVENDAKLMEISDNQPRWIIKGNKVMYGGDELAVLKVVSTATPKSLDLNFVKLKRTFEGIYSLEGDTLKICVNRNTEGVKERPQDFETQGKSDLRVLVFKKEKPGEDDSDGVAGYVGVQLRADQDKNQIVVSELLGDGPAKKAGLKKGDVVIKLGGADATNLQEVVARVRRAKPGSDLEFLIQRDGKEQNFAVKVGKLPFFYLD